MTFSNLIFLDHGLYHLPRGLRGGCRRGEDVDAPDQDIGDDIDNDIDDDGDYTDAPDQDIALVMMMMVIMWTNLLHFRLFSELLPPKRKRMSYHQLNCGFCSNRLLPYFPMSVCVCVSQS